jgi:tRNA (guanosine-2'-O-)-methyltransferase
MNDIRDKKALIEQLWQFVSENKRHIMSNVIQHRTRHVTVVLEDIFQPHNASAILRSCDIFGVQDVHVTEAKYTFKAISSISMGATKWVDVYQHATTADAIAQLKAQGYLIVATTPHTNSCELPQLPIDKKMALVFGSEQTGLSQEAMQQADMFVKIPMYGFVESFNVSVSVALCLYDVITRLHKSLIAWQLSQEEKENLLLQWMGKVSKTAALLQSKDN